MQLKYTYLLLCLLMLAVPKYHYAEASYSISSVNNQHQIEKTRAPKKAKKRKTKKLKKKAHKKNSVPVFNILGMASIISSILGLAGLVAGWITLSMPLWAIGLSLAVLGFLTLFGFFLFARKTQEKKGATGSAWIAMLFMLLAFVNGVISTIMGFVLSIPFLWITGISLIGIILLINLLILLG